MAAAAKPAGVKEIKEFFGTDERPMGLAEMKAEWVKGGLTDQDRAEIAQGIGDGSLTYPDRKVADLEPAA
jgi:hypothetical protein